jgi:hypothetical protein
MSSRWMQSREVYGSIADKATILRWEREGIFPEGICLSPRVKVYERAAVDAFVENRAKHQSEIIAKRAAVGARLVRGRAGSPNAVANAAKASGSSDVATAEAQ